MNPNIVKLFYARCGRSCAHWHPKGCWIWQGAKGSGYGTVGLDHENYIATHLSWEIANGAAPPPDLWVLHKCDIPLCVNPEHLFLGTNADNVHDMIAKGRRHKEVGVIAREANRKMRDAGFLTLKVAAALAQVNTSALHHALAESAQIVKMLGAKYARRVDVETWMRTPAAERARWHHAGLCSECGNPRAVGPYGPIGYCRACSHRLFPYFYETVEKLAVEDAEAAAEKLKK
jgi:hypothetical protein